MLKPPIGLACLECRSRKVKCSGKQPCEHCNFLSAECKFALSRRGGKRRIEMSPEKNPATFSSTDSSIQSSLKNGNATDMPQRVTISRNTSDHEISHITTSLSLLSSLQTTEEFEILCSVSMYYYNFHDSHPFLPPAAQLLASLSPNLESYVLYPLLYIGDLFRSKDIACHWKDKAKACFDSSSCTASLETVQGYTLYAFATYAGGLRSEGRRALHQAYMFAMELGFDKTEDTHEISTNRRKELSLKVWWEIYAACVLFSTFAGECCDCPEISSRICHGSSKAQQNFPFLETQLSEVHENEKRYGSYPYFVKAITLLRRVNSFLNAYGENVQEEGLDSYIAELSSYFPSYSPSNDLLLTRARIIISMATIYLHAYFAQLQLPVFVQSPSCGLSISTLSYDMSSVISVTRCLDAAETIITIVRSSHQLERLCPFVACAINLSAFIHASGILKDWDKEHCSEILKEEIAALEKLSTIWDTPKTLLKGVRRLAELIHIFDHNYHSDYDAIFKESRELQSTNPES